MKRIAALGLLTVLLAGCGGGDDNPAPAPTPTATAEGFWTGTASTGVNVALAVLENGETWGVYTSGGALVGALYGNTISSGNTVSGAGKDFNIPSRTVTSATYSGTFSAKNSIKVLTSAGASFSGAYNNSYDQPASLSALAGTFSGWGVSGTTSPAAISATVSSTGAIIVPASLGCAATGTAKPRASGKNIFDVTVTFVGSTCALGNGTSTTGVGYYDTASRELLVMSMNSSKSDGFIFVGKK